MSSGSVLYLAAFTGVIALVLLLGQKVPSHVEIAADPSQCGADHTDGEGVHHGACGDKVGL